MKCHKMAFFIFQRKKVDSGLWYFSYETFIKQRNILNEKEMPKIFLIHLGVDISVLDFIIWYKQLHIGRIFLAYV